MRLLSFHIIIALLLLAAPIPAAAQENDDDIAANSQATIDSLLSLIKPDTPDSTKARLYFNIASAAVQNDTIMKYARLSLSYCTDADINILIECNQMICYVHYCNSELDSCIIYLKKNIQLSSREDWVRYVPGLYRLIASMFEAKNQFDSVSSYLNHALDMAIKVNDTVEVAECYHSMAALAFNKQLYENAEKYALEAARMDSLCNITSDLIDVNLLLGLVYQGQFEKNKDTSKIYQSFDYLKKAIHLSDSAGVHDMGELHQKYVIYGEISYSYIVLAMITGEMAYADSSIAYYKPAAEHFLNNNAIESYINCSRTNVEYLLFVKKNKEAEQFVVALGEYVTDKTPVMYKFLYYSQAERVYEAIGNWKKAFETQKALNQISKELLNDSTLNVIAETKAQQAVMVEKIEREKDEQIHAAETSRMRTLIFSLIGGLVLVSLLVFYILRVLSLKKKANKELSEKNNLLNAQKAEIESQRDEIMSQRDEIMSQRDEIATQKDIITEQWHEVETVNSKLVASINYAKRIQRAAVSSEDDVHSVFPDSFVLYRPRDIVSGDFYRCGRCGRYSVMITADCTGHGIPGGFLSMLGLSALKEYMVTEYDAENPGTVLDRIRDFIKTTLATSDNGNNVNDGMEMTICCYDYEQMQMRYAIANQTAFIVRGGEAFKLKGDLMPVGRFVAEKEHFQSFAVPIQKGDMVYTFSDGIQDQLSGGKEKRKFSTRQLLSVLMANADKPMETQCQLLEKAILDWRGNTPQVDDMTLVGVRV